MLIAKFLYSAYFSPVSLSRFCKGLLIGDKFGNVKNLVCYLLIAGTALISGGANAHMLSVDHHSHEVSSASDHEHNGHSHEEKFTAESSNTLADSFKLDANNSETLTQAHYSHGHSHHHASGLPASCDLLAAIEPQSLKPISYLPFVSSAISNNIERPKWLVTTPPVVSLLS